MATAIKLDNAKSVFLHNVSISGFNKGIEAVNSDLLLSGSNIQRCGIGLDLINSSATINRSQLMDNAIDLVVNKSRAYLLDSLVYRILRILPNGDYSINPYRIRVTAAKIINTGDIREKRKRLRQLLNILKKTPYAWTIYQIIREVLRFAGYHI